MEDLLKNNLLVDNELSYEKLDDFCNKVKDKIDVEFSATTEELNSLIAFLRLSIVYLYLCCCKEDFIIASIYKLLNLLHEYNDAFDYLIKNELKKLKCLGVITKNDVYTIFTLKKDFDLLRSYLPINANYVLNFVFINIEQELLKTEL